MLLVPLMLILSFLLDGLWGSIVGLLKAKFGINEIIITIMMNYLAIYLLDYLLLGPMGVGGAFPRSALIPSSAKLHALDGFKHFRRAHRRSALLLTPSGCSRTFSVSPPLPTHQVPTRGTFFVHIQSHVFGHIFLTFHRWFRRWT